MGDAPENQFGIKLGDLRTVACKREPDNDAARAAFAAAGFRTSAVEMLLPLRDLRGTPR